MAYYYKGNPYIVLGECKFKNPATRQWHEAVMYQRADDAPNKDEIYVRDKEEFYNRFKLINQLIKVRYERTNMQG